jgi:hypothetical protein
MPPYMTSPFQIRPTLLPGIPGYSFGKFNDRTPPSRFSISQVAITGNVATITVQLLEGLIPIIGALITIQGTQTAAGAFNVTNAALTGVTIDSTTGAGTLTFALTHANVATTADSGAALVPQPEVGDAATVSKGQQFAVDFKAGVNPQGKLISWEFHFPSAPSTWSVQLEGAIEDVDSQYEPLQAPVTNSSTQSSGTFFLNSPVNISFVRINVTVLTGGTSPTIVAKIMI